MNTVSVQLHPASLKHLAKGHPWVIKDQYTEKFRAKDRFLEAVDRKSNETFVLLNDTAHPKIKARLWSSDRSTPFEEQLAQRIDDAINKRLSIMSERENSFLIFGEADFLPGLFILNFKDGLVIQSYARYWKKFQKILTPILREKYKKQTSREVSWLAWQERDDSKKTALTPIYGKMPTSLSINEFGVNYLVKLDQGYDLGIYPDMSAIRKTMKFNWENKKVLNLYAYTGAWSLYPLHQKASEVTSVDLSEKYLNWLEENIKLNSFSGKHYSIADDVNKALRQLKAKGETFDFILCDPPSFSSDGKKTQSSLKAYQELLPLFEELLKKNGQALCFINTHSITRKRFDEKMKEYSGRTKLKKISSHALMEDCPLIKNFPEGDYLKGVLYTKKD